MRIHPWMAALSSVLLLLAAGANSASAQQVSNDVFQSGSPEPLEGRVRLMSSAYASGSTAELDLRGQSPGGVIFESAYETNDPGVLWPQGTPPGYQPYPQISPYHPANVAFDSTYNRDGLWFREMLTRNRDYDLTLEYLMVRYRTPGNAVVGARPAAFFRQNPGAVAAGGGGGGGAVGATSGGLVGVLLGNQGNSGPARVGLDAGTLQRLSVGPGVWPFPFVVQNTNFQQLTSVIDETLFPIRSLGFFEDHFKADGMRARWGYTDEDLSGLMVTGWFGTRVRDEFRSGRDTIRGIPITQAFLLANSPTGGQSPVFPRNGSLPLLIRDDIIALSLGTEQVTVGFAGVPQKYDVLFRYETSSFAAGGSLNLYHEPIYKRKWVTLRPTFGARYQYLDEGLTFHGVDSGFGYDLDFGATGTGGAGAANQVPTFRPDTADVLVPVDTNGNPFFLDSRLEADIEGHMAGPEAGFRYDFGEGKKFKVWGQSTFALLANHQRFQLKGDKIGEPILYFLATGDNFTDDAIGLDTDFYEETQHTVASPMFEQSVFFDIALFQHIPLLRKIPVLEAAQFRTGYTYTVIGNVSRPGESIEWRGFPDFPTIRNNDRKTWHTHNWSFAVNWEF